VHPDDRDYIDHVWRTAIQGAMAYDVEHRIVVAGEVRWLREKGDLEYDENGEHVSGIGTAQDITDRKQSEEALRLAEARSSGILSVSPDAIISIDDRYRITQFNDGAVQILGYSKAEAVGAPLDLLFPERLRADYRQHVKAFADGLETSRRIGDRDGIMVGRRKNGAEFPADVAISKLDVGGTRILTVALRDITEQTRVAREQRFLAEAGSVLGASLDYEVTLTRVAELAVQYLADLCVVDIVDESGEVRRLRVVCRDDRHREACERLERLKFERDRPFLLRTTLSTKRSLLIRSMTAASLPAFSQNDEHLEILRAMAPTSVITVPMVAYDRLVGGLALVSTSPVLHYGSADVRLAEELARRAALSIDNARLYRTAQRAIRERDDMMGIVAHDLRTPLAAVRMQAQLFDLDGVEHSEQTKRAAEMIDRASARMGRLIDDLLDVSRIESGRLQVDQARIAPAELVADFVEMQKPVARSAALELRTELEPDLPEIWADRNRLLQALENLVGNAIKFCQPGGRVTVGAAARGGDVLFRICDTGPGIPADSLPHVFDRFWQAQSSDRRGAGLGLAITRGIVEAHGGQIWVESTIGVGSTFYFSIPRPAPLYSMLSEPAPPTLH
jgi:PAS domain S-box-containing protein